MIPNNKDFIKKYGKFEFREMAKTIPQMLTLARINKEIDCGYRINNTKKRVKFYRKNKGDITIDFASVFLLGTKDLKKLLDLME